MVLLSHFAYTRITGGGYLFIREYTLGSDAVMLFFVLSGYVIAHVSTERDRTVTEYAVNRLARLYSVAFPALVLGILFDLVGRQLEPALYDGWWYEDNQPVWRFFCNLFFVNELWFCSVRPFSNGPYWSLGYEFWYYALYGAAFYFGGRLRVALIALIILISGPKIMLSFPIWLMGVWTYRFNQRKTVSASVGWLCFLSSILVYISMKGMGVDVLARDFTMDMLGEDFVRHRLRSSDEFLISYLYGLFVSMNFIGANAIAPALRQLLLHFEKPIRYCAGLTFSIYLLHYPLLHLFRAVYGDDVTDPTLHVLILVSTLGTIVLVGGITERKKHLAKQIILAFAPRALAGRIAS